jgi:hypothetical protein
MGIQVLGATAGIASVVYLIGAAVLWVRLHSLGLPAERVVSVIPRETFAAVGILTVFEWGGIALFLLGLALVAYYAGWPWLLGQLAKRTSETSHLRRYVTRLDESRQVLRFDPPSPGHPARYVRLPGPEVPRTFIGAVILISLASLVIIALESSRWSALAGSLIGLPVVILLVTENKRRASEFGIVSKDEPTPEELKKLHQASNDYVEATEKVTQLKGMVTQLRDVRNGMDTLEAPGLESDIRSRQEELEKTQRLIKEKSEDHNKFQKWDNVAKIRDALHGKPHVGLRFAQILAVTIFGGFFGLAVEADRHTVPVEWAQLEIAPERGNGQLNETKRWGVLIAQTSAGVYLAEGTPGRAVPKSRRAALVFFPTSSVRELRTDSVDRRTKAVSGTIAEQLAPFRLRGWLRALLAGVAALLFALVVMIWYWRAPSST